MDVFLISLVFLYISFSFIKNRKPSPTLSIAHRWLRWIVSSYCLAYLCVELDWFGKPFEVMFVTTFLGWFLLESAYTWYGIRMINFSGVPIFPKFCLNRNGSFWPNQPKYIIMREWLREEGFREAESLESELIQGVMLKSMVFVHESGKIRLQILFVPVRYGVSDYYIFSSKTDDGNMVSTDNIQIPYGGYYPESWEYARKPGVRSIGKLYKYHTQRIKNKTDTFADWDHEALHEINREQQALEMLNRDEGYLLPAHLHEQYGQISIEGRYRIWKEMWMLRYLGLPLRGQI